jgi:hypothetical protein
MQNLQLYIYVDDADGIPVAHRIELFNDEKISVTSSVQNFNDIGKIFTDYSQSFTIPASKHNNAILLHWYESAVGTTNDINPLNVDGAFDHRIKYYGFIEIDTIPFRDGKFTMEKSNKKNGYIESYTINFVGNLVQLKDKFKEDKLNSLTNIDVTPNVSYYNELNFEYINTEVIARIYDGGYTDVLFPLIGNNRRYEFNTASASDVATATGAIDYRDLFPAIPVKKILQYIQYAYGLGFSGEFLNSQTFSKLYLHCKNTEEMQVATELLQADLIDVFSLPNDNTGDIYNLTTNSLNIQYRQYWLEDISTSTIISSFPDSCRLYFQIFTASTNYNVHVYNNGLPFTSFLNQSGNQSLQFLNVGGFFTDVYNFTFFVNSDDAPVTFTTRVWSYFVTIDDGNIYTASLYANFSHTYSQTSTGFINIRNYIPDLKVSDFITGLVKMFNMVIVPTGENTFEFLPVELWYQNGHEIDITQFVEAEALEITKPKLFKKLDFKHEKSENVLNNAYRSASNNQEYGDLFFDNPNSAFTDNYEIKTPFEDIMWERYTDTTFLTATCWNKSLQAYTPKPVLLYDNGIEFPKVGSTLTNIYWTDGVDDYTIDRYRRFSNEIQLAATDLSYLQTLNWGVENSVWNLTFAPNGLYQQFYSQYILNLYNQRTRVIKAKAYFNPYLLASIKLNDRIILSNKRYLINTMTTDLTSGEVNLELINDFRDIRQNTTYLRYSNIPFLQVDNTAQEIQYIIYLNNYDTFDVKLSIDFLIYSVTTGHTGDILLNVTIPANTTAADRTDAVNLEYFKGGVGTIITLPVLQYA